MERLQKIISNAGITSRRKAEELILAGKVTVNGEIIKELGTKCNSSIDDIRVNGRKVFIDNEKIVILFNKPTKVITSMKDPQGRKKVLDFIDIKQRIYPIGRLDYDTSGLLLLTNDGELANHLMHPSYGVDKIYEVLVNGIPSEKDLNKLRSGILLEEGMTSPAQVIIKKIVNNKKAKINITIHEGKNRQVRRMFEKLDYSVVALKRIKYGFLTINGVEEGDYRFLSKKEIAKLKKVVLSN